jgi:hypothetical protein
MPTIIDRLVVELGLDPKGLTDGQRKAVESAKKTQQELRKSAVDIEASGKRAENFFTGLRNQALGLFAVLLGGKGLLDFVGDTTRSFSALAKTAQDVGESVPGLQSFFNVVARNGGNPERAKASIVALSQSLARVRAGLEAPTPEMGRFFAEIGAGINDPISEIYAKFNRKFGGATGQRRQEAIAIGTVGGLDIDTIHVLLKSVQDYNRELEESRRLGLVDPESAKRLEELEKSWHGVTQASEGLATALLTDLAPVLTEINEDLKESIRLNDSWLERFLKSIPMIKMLRSLLRGQTLKHVYDVLSGRTSESQNDPTMEKLPGGGVRITIPPSQADHPQSQRPPAANQSNRSGRPDAAKIGSSLYMENDDIRADVAQGISAGIYAEGGGLGIAANGAFGIEQLRGDRKRRLFAKYGTTTPTLAQQKEFLAWELHGGDKGMASVLSARSAEEALYRYIHNGMRPGPGEAGDLARGSAYLNNLRAAQADTVGAPGVNSDSHDRQISIGEVHVHTPATDGPGIARTLRDDVLVDQANQSGQN